VIVIAEAERDILLVLWDIDPLTNINGDAVFSDEEGGNGLIAKHFGVVTMFSTNFANEGIG
jgi:hypothetical protein